MRVEKSNKLGPGDPFPELKLQLMDGGACQLPGDLETPFTIVLFYRGHW